MPTLKHLSGPIRAPGQCVCAPSSVPAPLSPMPEPDDLGNCEPGPGNAPVEDCEYQCSPGVDLQPVVDEARRVQHELGMRPYRVFLVWQQRDVQRVWQEVARIELMPVRVSDLSDVDLDLTRAGIAPSGALVLREVSPQQVDEQTLRGWRDGAQWATTDSREFFYEVVMHERCPGGTKARRQRYTIATQPFLNGARLEWKVGLVSQIIARTDEGVDRTIEPGGLPFSRPRIVT